jgi:ribosomal-protein-alanine N-acetyltransferase
MGIGTEAASASIHFGFDRAGLARIVAIAMPENIGSRRVMEKAGMRLVGPAHHYGIDVVKYEISRKTGGDERPPIEE